MSLLHPGLALQATLRRGICRGPIRLGWCHITTVMQLVIGQLAVVGPIFAAAFGDCRLCCVEFGRHLQGWDFLVMDLFVGIYTCRRSGIKSTHPQTSRLLSPAHPHGTVDYENLFYKLDRLGMREDKS